MSKAGIKIPLSDLSGSTTPIPTTPPPLPGVIQTGTTNLTLPPKTDTVDTTTLADITTKYGKDASGFISRINKDWPGIKSNYVLPS